MRVQVLLTAVLSASVDEGLTDLAEPYVKGVCQHTALLFASGLVKSRQELGIPGCWSVTPPAQGPAAKRDMRDLDLHVFFDALVSVLTSRDQANTAAAVAAIDAFVSTLLQAGAAVSQHRAATAAAAAAASAPDAALGAIFA